MPLTDVQVEKGAARDRGWRARPELIAAHAIRLGRIELDVESIVGVEHGAMIAQGRRTDGAAIK